MQWLCIQWNQCAINHCIAPMPSMACLLLHPVTSIMLLHPVTSIMLLHKAWSMNGMIMKVCKHNHHTQGRLDYQTSTTAGPLPNALWCSSVPIVSDLIEEDGQLICCL